MANKREFKHWDSKLLFNVLQKVVQIRDTIEKQCYEKQINPENLPMSMLPSNVLFDMAVCYEAMYDKLMEEELVVCGYPRSSPTYH